MIIITTITGDIFSTIDYDKNIPIKYNDMKMLFNTNIITEFYYMIIKDNKNIFTNLYDIYEI